MVAIIVNPVSGRGRGRQAARELSDALARHGLETRVLETTARGDATRLAAGVDAAVETIVAVGGDGTFSEVAAGIAARADSRPRPRIAMVPLGTANMLARCLELPRDPVDAATLIARGHTVALDVARANDHVVTMVAGVGFDGACARAVNLERTGPIRMASYVLPILRELFVGGHPHLVAALEGGDAAPGETHEDLLAVIAATVPTYGGPFELASHADRADGLFDVVMVRGRPAPLVLVATMLAAMVRLVPLVPWVTIRRARALSITAPRPAWLQVDGEPAGATPVRLEHLPLQLEVIAPGGAW